MAIDSNNKIKVLYIAGEGRSGSTLLSSTLGQIDGFFNAGEISHIFGRGMTNNELCACGKFFKECEIWSKVVEHYRENKHKYDSSQIEEMKRSIVRMKYLPVFLLSLKLKNFYKQLKIISEHISKIYTMIHHVTGCQVIVDSSKSPIYAQVLRKLPNIELYVLHLVRDSRGVAYSWSKIKHRTDIPWKVEYMGQRGLIKGSIVWTVHQLSSEILKYSQSYLRIRYEDFIKEPFKTVFNILRFLGENNADFNFINKDSILLETNHSISGNPVRMEKDRISLKLDSAWLLKMKKPDKFIVTTLTLPLLIRYGYIPKRLDSFPT